jgi:hypothetical protein
MANYSVKHGSEAGYREELKTGEPCERCRNGHRQFARKYSKAGKAAGLSYSVYDVIDHLYQGRRGSQPGQRRTGPAVSHPSPRPAPQDSAGNDAPGLDDTGAETEPEPGLGARLGGMFAGLNLDKDPEYVGDDPPDYLHSIDPDPEPSGDWDEVTDGEEFVINAAGMRKIEDTLGTYMSVVGMTVEMIDPYCGAIAAQNMENMVSRWSKVISMYPSAAKLFLDTKGGTLMAWIGALQATWPLLYAAYEHHLSKTVKVEDGRLFRRDNSASNGAGRPSGFGDNLTPPMPDDFNYTAN